MEEGDVGVAAVPVNGRRLPRGESDVLPAPSVLGRGCETCDASLGRIVLFFAPLTDRGDLASIST